MELELTERGLLPGNCADRIGSPVGVLQGVAERSRQRVGGQQLDGDGQPPDVYSLEQMFNLAPSVASFPPPAKAGGLHRATN